ANPTAIPEPAPPALMCRAPRREVLRLHAPDCVIHVREPAFGRGGMAREHEHAEMMGLGARRAQAQIVESLAARGSDNRAEGPMEQWVGLVEVGQTLNLSHHLRADGSDVVMEPADAVTLIGEDGIRLDNRRAMLALRLAGMVEQ